MVTNTNKNANSDAGRAKCWFSVWELESPSDNMLWGLPCLTAPDLGYWFAALWKHSFCQPSHLRNGLDRYHDLNRVRLALCKCDRSPKDICGFKQRKCYFTDYVPVLLCLQAAEDMGLPEASLEEKWKSYVVNIDMVAFQKAACVKYQWTGQIPDMFVLYDNFLYLYIHLIMLHKQMKTFQQSPTKIQECKNLQTKVGNTIQLTWSSPLVARRQCTRKKFKKWINIQWFSPTNLATF